MTKTKRKPGRPRKTREEQRGALVSVRLMDAERQVVTEAARRTGLSVSEWSRRRMLFGTVRDVT